MKRPQPGKAQANSLRIIGGQWRSRKISFPDVSGLRPTGDRIRETLFNWLQNDVPAASCLDLFAGSGACGLEALSRGAAYVLFVEKNPAAAQAIRANLAALQAEEAEVRCADAFKILAELAAERARRFDLVFVDPPYALQLLPAAMEALAGSDLLNAGARIYLESDQPLDLSRLPDRWSISRNKKAGAVHYYLAETE